MTIDKSLRVRTGMMRTRNVLTRAERIEKLKAADRWLDGDSVHGLPKVRVQKLALKKKKKAIFDKIARSISHNSLPAVVFAWDLTWHPSMTTPSSSPLLFPGFTTSLSARTSGNQRSDPDRAAGRMPHGPWILAPTFWAAPRYSGKRPGFRDSAGRSGLPRPV